MITSRNHTCNLMDMPRFRTMAVGTTRSPITVVTYVDDDWLLTRELRSSLHSSGVGSNVTYLLNNMINTCWSVVTAVRSGHIIHRSVYHQHKGVDEDRGSQWVVVVQWCTAETASSQELRPVAPRIPKTVTLRCLTAREECHGVPCRWLLRNSATPRQTDSHHQMASRMSVEWLAL